MTRYVLAANRHTSPPPDLTLFDQGEYCLPCDARQISRQFIFQRRQRRIPAQTNAQFILCQPAIEKAGGEGVAQYDRLAWSGKPPV